MDLPPRCENGRCAGVFATDPQHGFQEEIVTFQLNGESTFINPESTPGLTHVSILDLTLSRDGIAVLMKADVKEPFAAPQSRRATPPLFGPTPSQRAERDQYFITSYKQDGTYLGTDHLAVNFIPIRMALVKNDRFLMSGFDTREQKPVLVTLRSDGQDVRPLDYGALFPSVKDLVKESGLKYGDKEAAGMENLASGAALSSMHFEHLGDAVVMVSTHAGSTVLWSHFEDGVQPTTLKLPGGTMAATVISSTTSLYLRAFASDQDGGMVFELNPENGALLRRMDSKGVPGTSVFYIDGGVVYALWSHEGKTFIVHNS